LGDPTPEGIAKRHQAGNPRGAAVKTPTIAILAQLTGLRAPALDLLHSALGPAIQRAELNTPARIAHFLAQCHHETGGFTKLSESLNYTPAGLMATWPNRFPWALAHQLGRWAGRPADQKQIAITAYGGRGGNAPAPSEDGWSYRGRGWIQLTHRGNYRAAGKWIGIDLESKPDQASTHAVGAQVAAWYWATHDLNRYADRHDAETVSRIINCGPHSKPTRLPHGLFERIALTERYLGALQHG
jgi:putative chitinase